MKKKGVHNFFQLQKLRKLWNFEFSNFRLFIFLNFHLLLKCCFKKRKKGLKLKSILIEHLNMTPKDCPKELLQNLEHHVNDSVQNTRNNPYILLFFDSNHQDQVNFIGAQLVMRSILQIFPL